MSNTPEPTTFPPAPSPHNSPIVNALIIAAAAVVVVAGIHAARAIVIPFLLAIFVAVIISAVLAWLRERKIHTGIAVFLLIVVMGVLGTLMVLVVGASVNELVRKLPQIHTAVQKQEKQFQKWMDEYGFILDKPERNNPQSRSLEISVPGLIPPFGSGTSEEEKTDPSREGQKTPPAAEPVMPPVSEVEAEPPVTAPAELTGETPVASPSAETVPVPPGAPEAGELVEGEMPLPEQNEKNDPPATDSTSDEEADEELTREALLEMELENRARFRTLYPDYIFGPQKHIIEFLPSPTGSVSSTSSGIYNFFSPVQIFRSFLDSVMGVLNYALIVFLMLMFLMLEWSRFGQKLEMLPGNTQSYVEQVTEILASIRRYMFIKTLVSLLTGLLITIWLLFLGTGYAALWGTVAFLFNYIPTIGSIIAGIVPTLFVLVDQGPVQALYVGIAFLVVNFLIGNILEPRIMGEGLGLSTFVVFLSLVFWGWVLGPVGMLLAVPLTMALKIALASDARTRWVALMLGSSATLESVKIGTNKK